jgi:hypothetical protein
LIIDDGDIGRLLHQQALSHVERGRRPNDARAQPFQQRLEGVGHMPGVFDNQDPQAPQLRNAVHVRDA